MIPPGLRRQFSDSIHANWTQMEMDGNGRDSRGKAAKWADQDGIFVAGGKNGRGDEEE
jgi:hypothetical protein